MKDVGQPFSEKYPFKSLIAALETSLREGVEQTTSEQFYFMRTQATYPLSQAATSIQQVSGSRGGKGFIFIPEQHYRFANNRIIWSGSEKPDEGTPVWVDYTYRDPPSGLTDFNSGSVAGTLVRAVARELALLYKQMDEAYRRAFINSAAGVALENVVALLGIQRIAALPSEGEVLFFRRKATDRPYKIPRGTQVADESGHVFETDADAELKNEPLVEEQLTPVNGKIETCDMIDADSPLEIRLAAPPQTNYRFTPISKSQPFGDSGRTIQLESGSEVTGVLNVRYTPRSVRVKIKALKAGPESNLNAGLIKIMPSAPRGIEGVTNPLPTHGGQAPESDDALRDRACHNLELLGHATLDALKYAVLKVAGVDAVDVSDYQRDSTIPLGEVRITYLAVERAGLVNDIQDAIEKTRAAGIRVVLAKIEVLQISATFYLLPDLSLTKQSGENFKAAVTTAINALEVGRPLSLRKLNALVYPIPGLADVAEAQISTGSGAFITTDPFAIQPTQVIRLAEGAPRVIVLSGLKVKGTPTHKDGEYMLKLFLIAGALSAGDVCLNNFSLNLKIELLSCPKTGSNSPLNSIGSLKDEYPVTFKGGCEADLVLSDKAIQEWYDPNKHAPNLKARISAAAFPGLSGDQASLISPAE